MDNETEAAIQRSLDRITAERTTLVIAHRLSTVRLPIGSWSWTDGSWKAAATTSSSRPAGPTSISGGFRRDYGRTRLSLSNQPKSGTNAGGTTRWRRRK